MGWAGPLKSWLRGLTTTTVDMLVGKAGSPPSLGQKSLLRGAGPEPGLPAGCGGW